MKVRVLVLVAAGALVASACGSNDTGLVTTSISTSVVEFQCPDPVAVTTAEEILAILAETDWRGSAAYSIGTVSMTPDLAVSGTVVLHAEDVPVPASCLERNDCFDGASFLMGGGYEGVTIDGTAGPDFQTGAATLTLSDTTIRLQPYLRDTHPGPYNAVPFVSVAEACSTPCREGSKRCPVDGVCYAEGDIYCRRCEGFSAADCVCRLPDASFADDGEFCSYPLTGDVMCAGECRNGTCVAEGC